MTDHCSSVFVTSSRRARVSRKVLSLFKTSCESKISETRCVIEVGCKFVFKVVRDYSDLRKILARRDANHKGAHPRLARSASFPGSHAGSSDTLPALPECNPPRSDLIR